MLSQIETYALLSLRQCYVGPVPKLLFPTLLWAIQPSSVETPVPSITEVKQHWDRSVLGWVTLQVTCLLYDLSGWLGRYINVECCMGLSMVLATERPLGANREE